MKNTTIVTLLIILMSGCNSVNLELPALVSDNMILQQKSEASIWGWSKAGTEVEVIASWGESATVETAEDGKWMTQLTTPEFGGPYTILIKAGKTEKSIKNVLIGEVWLCSGQSNMEMPLNGFPPNDRIKNAEEEIANAELPNLRMFTVANRIAMSPQTNCIGSWEPCTPETAGSFSATAYFFGKKIHQELGVPVGLIHSSWGGTPAEAWTSAKRIETVEGFENISDQLEEGIVAFEELKAFTAELEVIGREKLTGERPYENLNINDKLYADPNFDAAELEAIQVPSLWERSELPGFDGIVWVFKDFEYSGDTDDLQLFLGPIDDMDVTYVNGVKVGSHEYSGVYQKERLYEIPHNVLNKGNNRIAVKVIDTGGGGGIFGPGVPALKRGEKTLVDLGGEWNFLPVALLSEGNLIIYGAGEKSYAASPKMEIALDQNSPTTLYNGMINPLVPYTIKGAIWYQGESNVGRGEQYETLFPTMITNWRDVWKQGDFPFYFVQIAPYNYGPYSDVPVAELRDAQFKTLKLKNTGMAVTMDIGNPSNIHPGNKQDVGARLALWALHKDYGFTDLVYSGPLFKVAKFQGKKVEVSFEHAQSGLVLEGDDSFVELAGEDGTFYRAKVNVEGDKLIASCNKVSKPIQIRYAWCDDCEPNLFNQEGLPASPFSAMK